MLHDLDRLGPELIVMVAAGGVLLADLALRERNRGWLPFVAPAGLAASGIWGLVIIASAGYVRRLRHQGEFWALLLLATSGMMLLAGARDLILIFIALELTSISQYILAAMLKDDRASEAGLKYILLGAVASAVILYGMAFLFGIAGTTALVSADGGASIAGLVAEGDPGTRAALVAAIVLLAAR